MFTSSLLAAASLLLATALADSSPYSKFVDDANALLAAATGKDAAQLDALNSWQSTQTALPSADIESQYQDYLDAYMTATSAPLPTWVAAIPSSLQAVATSFLQAEASLVVQDIAPIVSQYNADLSASPAAQATPTVTTLSSNDTVVSTSAPSATASSGFATLPANSTAAQVSGSGTAPAVSANSTGNAPITPVGTAGGTPTKSVTPPVSTFGRSGAKKRAGVAVLAAVVGVLGMIVLL